MRTWRLFRYVSAAAFCLLMLSGCEQIFTYTPFEALQRPPGSLSPAEQLTYGEDALASGDTAAMQAAYDVLNGQTDSADAQLLAADLAVELSGMSDYLLGLASNTAVLPDPADPLTFDSIDGFIAGTGVDVQLLIAAGQNLQNAQADGGTLEPMDYLMGGLGLVLDAAEQPDGSFDFAVMDAAKLDEAQSFVTQASFSDLISTLEPTDPLLGLLVGFQDYIVNTL